MSERRFTVRLDASMNISQVKSAVQTIQADFSKLNIPPEVGSRLTGTFDKIMGEIERFQSMSAKGIGSGKEFSQLERSGNKILQLYEQLRNQARDLGTLSDAQLEKMFPPQLQANIKKAAQAFKTYESEVAKGKTAIEKHRGAISKLQGDIAGLERDIEKTRGMKIVGSSGELTQMGKDVAAARAELEGLEKEAEETRAKISQMEATLSAPKKSSKYRELQTQLEGLSAKIVAARGNYTSLQAQFSNTTTVSKQATALKNLEGELATARGNMATLVAELANMQQVGDTTALQNLITTLNQIPGIKIDPATASLKEIQQVISQLSSGQLEQLRSSLSTIGASVNGAKGEFDRFGDELDETRGKVQGLDSQLGQVNMLKSRISYFFGLTNSIFLLRRAVTSAMETVKELDKTMTEAAVVTDFSVGDMWDKFPQYAAEASKLGATTNELYQATTLYYQQGLKSNEAMKVGIETMKMARIAGIDASEATQAMTAALRGFNMELNEASATRVNDVYSKLAAITAADTSQIATAMEKTASIAHSANMEFETTAALLAQIIETTQEAPETAGTAVKTIIARFSEVKELKNKGETTGKDEEGEEIDVNKIQTALRTVGISMDEYFSGAEGLDKVLLRLAEKWDDLDFETQRYIATMAAGSRQQSRFIAMMSDYGRTMELVGAANNSAGASQKQFEKTLDSMEAKLNKLKNAWDNFTTGLANNEIIKTAIDLLTEVLTCVNNLIDRISGENGLLKSALSLAAAFGALKLAGPLLTKSLGFFTGIGGKNDGKKAAKELENGGKAAAKELVKGARQAASIEQKGAVEETGTENAGAAADAATKTTSAHVAAGIEKQGAVDEEKIEHAGSMGGGGGGFKGTIGNFFKANGRSLITTAAIAVSVIGILAVADARAKKADALAVTSAEKLDDLYAAEAEAQKQSEHYASQLSNFEQTKNTFKEMIDSLGKLRKGTTKWASTMHDIRLQMQGILKTYPDLQQYTEMIDGVRVLTTEGWEQYEKSLLNSYYEQEAQTVILQMLVKDVEMVQAAEGLSIPTNTISPAEEQAMISSQKNTTLASGFIGGAVGLGVGILAGAKAGSALGTMVAPGIGTLIGAAIGIFVGGLIANLSDDVEDATEGVAPELVNDIAYKAAKAGFLATGASEEDIKGLLKSQGLTEGTEEFKYLSEYIKENGEEFDAHTKAIIEANAELKDFGFRLGAALADKNNMEGDSAETFTNVAAMIAGRDTYELKTLAQNAILSRYDLSPTTDFASTKLKDLPEQMIKDYTEMTGYTYEGGALYNGEVKDANKITETAEGVYSTLYSQELSKLITEQAEFAYVSLVSGLSSKTAKIVSGYLAGEGDVSDLNVKGLEDLTSWVNDFNADYDYLSKQNKTLKDWAFTALQNGSEDVEYTYEIFVDGVSAGTKTSTKTNGANSFEDAVPEKKTVEGDAWYETLGKEAVAVLGGAASVLQMITSPSTGFKGVKIYSALLNAAKEEGEDHTFTYKYKDYEWKIAPEEQYEWIAEQLNKDKAEEDRISVEAVARYFGGETKLDTASLQNAQKDLIGLLNKYSANEKEYGEEGFSSFLENVTLETAKKFDENMQKLQIAAGLSETELKDYVIQPLSSIAVEIEDETMREQILNLLAGIDITNLTQLRTAEEYINTLDKEVGKSVEQWIEQLVDLKIAVADIDIETLKTQMEAVFKVVDKISKIKLDEEAIFSQEELNAILSAGGAREEFYATIDGFVYIGDNLQELNDTLVASNAILLGLQHDALKTKVDVAEKIESDDDLKGLDWGSTDTWTHKQIAQFVKGAVRDGAWEKFLGGEAITEEDLAGSLLANWSPDLVNDILNSTVITGEDGNRVVNTTTSDWGKDIELSDVQETALKSLLSEYADAYNNRVKYKNDYDTGLTDLKQKQLLTMDVEDLLTQDTHTEIGQVEKSGSIVEFTDARGNKINGTLQNNGTVIDEKGDVYGSIYQNDDGSFSQKLDETGVYTDEEIQQNIDLRIKQNDLEYILSESIEELEWDSAELAKNNNLLKAHVVATHDANKTTDKFGETIRNYEEVLKSGNKQSDAYNEALAQIGKSAEVIFGMKFDGEFIEQNLDDFLALAEGGEAAESAWERLTQVASEVVLASLADQLDMTSDDLLGIEERIAGLNGLNLAVGGTADFSQIFSELATLMQDADNAEAYLTSLGYEVTWVEDGYTDMVMPDGSVSPVPNYKALVTKKGGVGTGTHTPSSGGSKKREWENPYDEHYNTVQKINAELKERERLERRYALLLKKNATTAEDLGVNKEERLSTLEDEKELREYLLGQRTNDVKKLVSENSEYSDYAWFDEERGIVQIDWEKIQGLDGSTDEEFTSGLEEYISKLEEGVDLIEEEKDGILDIEETTHDIYEEGKDRYFDLETKVRDAVLASYQKEIDKLSEINKTITETNSDLIDAMQKAIDEERQARENEKTEEALMDKEQKILYLQQDTSGANELEILQLQKELDDDRQSYTDALIDQKITELQDQNKLAADQRDRQITIAEQQLDWYKSSGAVWQEVNTLLQSGIDPATGVIIDGSALMTILKEQEEYPSMSKLGQLEWGKDISKLAKEALSYLWDGRSVKAQLNDGTLKEGQTIKFEYDGQTLTGKVNKDGSVTSNGKVYSDIYQSWDGNYYSKGGKPTNEKPPASSNSGDKKDTTNAQIGAAYSILYSSNAGGWGNGDVRKRRLKEIFGSDNKVQSYINRIAGGEKISYTGSRSDYSYKALGGKENTESQNTGGGSTGGDTSSKGTNSGSTGGSTGGTGAKDTPPKNVSGSAQVTIPDSPNNGIIASQGLSHTEGNNTSGQNPSSSTNPHPLKGYSTSSSATLLSMYYSNFSNGKKYRGFPQVSNRKIWPTKLNGQTIQAHEDYNGVQWLKLNDTQKSSIGYDDSKHAGVATMGGYTFYVSKYDTDKTEIPQFKTGGLADFTGPAWLDGTKSKPEYILNADQTRAFFTLVDVLQGLKNIPQSSTSTENNGDNVYDIDINVESIGNDYDVEQMAETIKRLINDDARYRNNNAINLMR